MQSLWSNKGGGQGLLAGIAIIAIALGAYFIFKQTKSKDDSLFGDIYYYCTNCEKEFPASSSETAPIKCPFCKQMTGVIAAKFKCKECNEEFIGYIQKYDAETKRLIDKRKRGEKVPDEQIGSILVSEPGEEDWIEASTPEGNAVMSNLACPKCESFDVERIFPPKKK